MAKFTTKELNDLIGSGNEFTVQIAAQLLSAESTIKAMKHLIVIYFEGCSSDEFDDRMRELKALLL